MGRDRGVGSSRQIRTQAGAGFDPGEPDARMHSVGLPIKQVAERTGIAAGTIRMWEQRYGFPEPARTASGYRMYTDEDVDALRRVSTLRDAGLSVPAALERARTASGSTDRPSIYGAIAAGDEPVPARR